MTLFAATALVFGCKEEKEPEPAIPVLTVGQSELSFEQNGGTATVSVTSNRPWTISTDADWLAFNPSSGGASDAPVSVTVTALSNTSNDRTSSFKVKTDFDFKTVTVSQKGQKGEDPNVTPSGSGTAADPYNVVAANNAVKDLTWTSNEEYQSTDYVYVKGKISRIADKGSFTDGGSYGNASFYISTDGTSSDKDFYVYRALYLGNKKFKTGQTDIKVGDEVIVYGKLMNYKGNTPETVSGSAYLYSLNGETGGGQGTDAEAKGAGTLEDPYNPAGAAAAVANLTWTSNEEYQSTDNVYVKGKISRIADKGTFTDGGTYGNASFFIVEEGTDFEFQVYRALYLGNKKFESGQTDIKVGDEVIIYGKLMNYRNNTPETVSGKSYLYSLNGVTGGDDPGPGPTGDPKGTGTLEDPYNPAGAAAAVANLTWTSNEDYQTTGDVYVKGKICKIANNGTFTEGGTYGNASFYISEDGEGDGEFYVFRTLYLGNKQFESGQTDIKVGDEVIIYGKLMNYRNNTPETVSGKTYVYSLNGVTGGDEPGPDPGPSPSGDPKGTGTLDDPYNPSGAAAAVKDLTWTSNTEYQTTGEVYVKGKICKIANSGTFTEGGTFGNASFFISEDGKGDGEFYVFRTLYLGNRMFAEGDTDIKVGDEVIIYGKLMNYKNNTPETVSGKCYLYSLNGVTGGDEPGPGGESEDLKTATIAEFLAAADSKTQPYKLTGKVSNIVNNTYGNFDLTDATGTVYVYGLVAKDLGGYGPNKANDKSFASIGIQENDEITIIGYRETYTNDSGSTNEVVGAYYVSGASGSGETPGDFSSNVEWTKGESATDAKATINGKEITALKLGTSSKTGTATIVLPKGSTSISFYGVSWKGKKAKLLAKIGEKEFFTQDLATNDGAAGNPPFTMTVTGSDCYTKTFDALASETTVTLTTTGSNTRIILFGINVK